MREAAAIIDVFVPEAVVIRDAPYAYNFAQFLLLVGIELHTTGEHDIAEAGVGLK